MRRTHRSPCGKGRKDDRQRRGNVALLRSAERRRGARCVRLRRDMRRVTSEAVSASGALARGRTDSRSRAKYTSLKPKKGGVSNTFVCEAAVRGGHAYGMVHVGGGGAVAVSSASAEGLNFLES